MRIQNCTLNDLDKIFRFYREATQYQKIKNAVLWPEFNREMVKKEIVETRQWKMSFEASTACVWATTFHDPEIWGTMDTEPSVYIHRIAVHPDFRGRNLVKDLVNWSKEYALKNNRRNIRLDTIAGNENLIRHYTGNGFEYLGDFFLKKSDKLPNHYWDTEVSLFQISLSIT